jgi:1-phosphatidylinositol-3-phosphate 5-kinase
LQVSVKHLRGGKETKMDLMVMENLFFRRSISRVYDLKGSSRSRYNPDTTGTNKVLLDMNLLETLRTKPIFLGSRAKRSLERAVWNDTSFLAVIFFIFYSFFVHLLIDMNASRF